MLLEIEEKKNSPHIKFDLNSGACSILGRSFPENAKKFYDPIYAWLDENLGACQGKIVLDLYFYYLSSSSVIAVLDLIKIFDNIHGENVDLQVNWRYDIDDDDVKRIGEDYNRIIGVNINIISEE